MDTTRLQLRRIARWYGVVRLPFILLHYFSLPSVSLAICLDAIMTMAMSLGPAGVPFGGCFAGNCAPNPCRCGRLGIMTCETTPPGVLQILVALPLGPHTVLLRAAMAACSPGTEAAAEAAAARVAERQQLNFSCTCAWKVTAL